MSSVEDNAVDMEETFTDFNREFDLVDEILDEGDEAEEGQDQDDDESDFGISDDELDKLLEEDLPEEFRKKRKIDANAEEAESFTSEKYVVQEKCPHHDTPLPKGWIFANHVSGVRVYLHKESRVCTLSRPYFLGPASVRKHNVPLSAIPCLQYRTAKEEEETKRNKYEVSRQKKESNEENEVENPTVNGESTLSNGNADDVAALPAEHAAPSPEQRKTLERILRHSGLQTQATPDLSNLNIPIPEDANKTYAINSEQLRDYVSTLMEIKKIEVKRFKNWQQRRLHCKKERPAEVLDVPTGPEGKRIFKFQVFADVKDKTGKRQVMKDWIMNPNGKSYVCILHEYMQHVMKKMPKYVFTELENASTPYGCSVTIDDVKYGVAQGPSKKIAKLEAAKKALEILIPQIREFIKETEGPMAPKLLPEDLSFFDEVPIEDPRVASLCTKVSEPTPYPILLTCIQRNFGLGENNIEFKMNTMKNQKNEAEMTVGKHTVRVPCKNKKDGKQLASQGILQAMHPHIKTWGSMLRLYGNQSLKPLVEKKAIEKGITVLQGKATVNEPNYAILEKLKFEMDKLYQKKESYKPIGKFTVPTDVEMPSYSASNLKNVEI